MKIFHHHQYQREYLSEISLLEMSRVVLLWVFVCRVAALDDILGYRYIWLKKGIYEFP